MIERVIDLAIQIRAKERVIGRKEERIRVLGLLRDLMRNVKTMREADLLKFIGEEICRPEEGDS